VAEKVASRPQSHPLALASPHTLPTHHHRQHRQQAPSSTMTVITRGHKATGHDDASSYVHSKLRAYNKDPNRAAPLRMTSSKATQL